MNDEIKVNKDFSELHKSMALSENSNIQSQRFNSVKNICENNDINFWFNLVRLALGLKTEALQSNKFVDFFKQYDDSFPLSRNTKLLKDLASLTLSYKIRTTKIYSVDDIDNPLVNKVSLAVNNATFSTKCKLDKKMPLEKTVLDYLGRVSSYSRKIEEEFKIEDLNAIEERLREEETPLQWDESLDIVMATKHAYHTNKVMYEELNILWWLMGEYSSLLSIPFKKIDDGSILILAKELADLMGFPIGLYTSKHILHKAVALTPTNYGEIETQNFIKLIPQATVDILLKDIENTDEFTPVLSGLKTETFNELNLGCKVEDLIHQLYKEYLYLKIK